MKRCKDCGWTTIIDGPTMTAESFRTCTRRPKGSNGTGECEFYVRKPWLWFAWWIPKVLLLTLALMLTGCTTWNVDKTAYRLDGSIESRTRASMNQWFTDSTRTKVAVEINDIGKAEIGSSVLDAESLAEIIKALPESLRKEILALLGIGL